MYWWYRYHLRNNFKGWYWKKANQETRHSYQKHHQLCLNVNFVLVPKGSSQVAEKRVALARIGHSATTWCSFLSWRKQKRRKYQRIKGNSSHVTRCFGSYLMHHCTSEVNWVCWALSAPLSGWPDVRYCRKQNRPRSQNLTRKVTCVKHISTSNAWV